MKRSSTIILVLAVIFLLSCRSQPSKAGQFNFKQGIAEPQIHLIEGAPPARIFPNSNFKLIANVDNQAAYPVTDGKLSLVGVIDRYFTFDELEKSFNSLEGRSILSPGGEKAFIEFSGKSGQLFLDAKEYLNNYLLIASYNSKMDFIDSICITSSLYTIYDAGCTAESKKSYSGQGAPLSVTDLEEVIMPGQGVELRLTLKNRGRGKVTFLTLESAHLGAEPMKCEFSGVIGNKQSIQFSTDKQEAILICTQPLRNQRSYTTSAAVSFNYGYEQTEQYQLRLVK